MITKKVYRYYCEYCKKSGGSKHHMRIHEEHCTMNPNRACRMCQQYDNIPVPMNELLDLLPEMSQFAKEIDGGWRVADDDIIDKAMEELKEKTENCPACILAALRQKGIIVPLTNYNYREEVKGFWREKEEAYY